jgi:hypothetical protein
MGGIDGPIKGGEKDQAGFVLGFEHGIVLFRGLAISYRHDVVDVTARIFCLKFQVSAFRVSVAPVRGASSQIEKKNTIDPWRYFRLWERFLLASRCFLAGLPRFNRAYKHLQL